jgi:UDP-N-acetylmuramate--alanine ligase
MKNNLKKVFISGIGGIGVSALARFFVSRGVEVVGSDANQSEITLALAKSGIKVFAMQTADNVDASFDLFVYSSAVPAENPERLKAKFLNLEQKSYFEVLGEVSRDFQTIAVSGTNGKSTTTAMIASILIDADKSPTVIVGSTFEKLDNNFRAGKSNLFIVEACEYRAHMLLLTPASIVLTNIEEDHLDFYKDINHIVQTFQQYISSLREKESCLVLNNDDVNIRKLKLPKCQISRFGLIEGADVRAINLRKAPGRQIFDVLYFGQNLGEFELQVPGDFNVYNALAAISYSLTLNIPVGIIKNSLKEYRGIWRRFQIVKSDEFTVISDYGHHPTAIQGTLKAAKEFYPGRRIIAVFQPHQHDRTKKLFNDFVKSFGDADVVVLSEIYGVPGREESNTEISSKDLALAIQSVEKDKQILFAKDLDEALQQVNAIVKPEDVVLVIGAGDVYTISDKVKGEYTVADQIRNI